MREHVEVAVVGGGIMGTCAAWRLALAGRDVALLERFPFGHDKGSSHGATRIFRYAYGDATYVRMAMAALPFWHELGDDLITFTGGLDTSDPHRVEATKTALEDAGAHAELLDDAELRRRAPWLERITGPALFSPDTGVIAAARAVDAARAAARDAGAHLFDETNVTKIEPDDHGVTLTTPGGTIRAERAVLAAGAWMRPMLASTLGVDAPLRVTKESVFYFQGTLPLVVISWISSYGGIPWYAMPALHGAQGAKLGFHGAGIEIDPDVDSRDPDPRPRDYLKEIARDNLTTLRPEPVHAETCLYTSTPDEAFVIDVRGPIVVASPCSGHGFKFGPLLGETLACLATGRTPPIDVSAFRTDRPAGW